MSKKFQIYCLITLIIICVALSSYSTGYCQAPPNGKYWSVAIADTVMKRYPKLESYPWRPWCYPQGYMFMGFNKLWKSTGNKKYYDYMLGYTDRLVDENGNIQGFTGESLDDIMPGSTVVWAYQQTGLKKYKLAADKVRKAFDDYPRTSDGLFWHNRKTVGEAWVDGVFMGQMFLAKYGKYVSDGEYCFNEASKQLILMSKHLTKGNSGLLFHAWDEDKDASWANKETGLSSEVWSEGLGWYALVLVETLDIMPEDHPKRAELVKITQNLMKGLKNTQDAETGLWHQIVDKGDRSDNWHDTSGSSMFLYGIKRSIELGLIPATEFDPVVEKAYKGITTKVRVNTDDGLLDIFDCCNGVCVQDNYDIYINYKKTVNAQEVVPGFLWGTWIVEKPGPGN
jgi:rhamnogalacturonyl hydrolase YesR